MDKIKVDMNLLNDVTKVIFLDTCSDYSENSQFDVTPIEHLNFTSIVDAFLHTLKESNKYWDQNPGSTGAFDLIKRKSYESGQVATPSHHITVSRFLLNEKEQIFSLFGKFDCCPAVFVDGGYSHRNTETSIYYKAHMKWTGVSNVSVKKRVFNYKTLKEVESKVVPWSAIQNYVARCYHGYVGLREICDLNGRAVFVIDVGYRKKTGMYTFYEISFDYTGGMTDTVEIPPYNFQHWNYSPKWYKTIPYENQKFKKRKYKAKKKSLARREFGY